jgi:hypothetical protein
MKRVNEAIKKLAATVTDPNADRETILNEKFATCMAMMSIARDIYAEYVNLAPHNEQSLNAKLSLNAMLQELSLLSGNSVNESNEPNDCAYAATLEYYNSLKHVAIRNVPNVKETFERLKVSLK